MSSIHTGVSVDTPVSVPVRDISPYKRTTSQVGGTTGVTLYGGSLTGSGKDVFEWTIRFEGQFAP